MQEMMLTVEQVAERLQLQPETIRRQLLRGALRGVKRGRVWRVPQSALVEGMQRVQTKPAKGVVAQADVIWAQMRGDAREHNAALRALADAPEAVRSEIMRRSGEVAAKFYATPEGEAEWRETADWMNGAAGPLLDEPIQAATTATAPSHQDIGQRMSALAALLDDLPNNRAQAGLPPLTDEDISPEAIYGDD